MAPLEPQMNNKENGLKMRRQVVKRTRSHETVLQIFSDWMEKETFINPVATNHHNVPLYCIKLTLVYYPQNRDY